MEVYHKKMLRILLAPFLILSGASASLIYVPATHVQDPFTTPYNVSPLSGDLGIGRMNGSLVARQTCTSLPGWSSCAAASGCCITGDNCCAGTGGVLYGCCRAGYDVSSTNAPCQYTHVFPVEDRSQCGVNNLGNLVCNAVGGGGTTTCASQGLAQCTHVNNACCPVGSDCTTVNNNIVCAPINSAPPPQASTITVVSSTTISTTSPQSSSTSTSGLRPPTIVTTPVPQPLSSVDPGDVSRLLECQPCGSSQCSFTSSTNLADTTYDVLVGSAVTNCNGGTTSIKSTIGGSLTVGSSWSIGATIGTQLGVLKIDSQYTYGQQKSVQLSQSLEIEIEPGKQGALVATILYNRIDGSMKIGSRAAFPLVLNEPGSNTYSQQIIPCGQKFTANIVSPQKCASGARAGVAGLVPSIFSLVSIAAVSIFVRTATR